MVVGVAAQGDCNALRIFQRHVVETPDVIDKIVLDHDVMNARPVEFNQRQGMVPGIDVHERSPERRTVRVIAEPQTDGLQVEFLHFPEIAGLQHQVAETQGAGPETADGARRRKRCIRGSRFAVQLDPVTVRVAQPEHVLHLALVALFTASLFDLESQGLQAGYASLQFLEACSFQPEEGKAVAFPRFDQDPVPSLVHA